MVAPRQKASSHPRHQFWRDVLIMWKLLLASCALLAVFQQIAGVQYCPNTGFQLWNGYCYFFVQNDGEYWQTARSKCQQMSTTKFNVDLVSIGSAEEDRFVYDIMESSGDYWLGLKVDEGGDGSSFSWVDGNDGTYRNWERSFPKDGNTRPCAQVRVYTNNWNNFGCGQYYDDYVCKVESISGWEQKGDWEYFINAGSGDESLNWFRARDWCNENGGELASITSDAETNNIYELLELMGFKADLWIGLNRVQGDQTKWTWSDGTDGSYDNWKTGYPTEDTIYRHHCGTIYTDDDTGEWRNAHCDSLNNGFVCKRKPGDTGIKTTPAPVTGGGFCPRGYIDAGDKCFRVHARNNENGHSWAEAVNYCRTGSNYCQDIATISNPYEQAVINSALQKSSLPLWVGLYRTGAGNAEWLWSDNSQFEYTNWGLEEPISRTALCAAVRPFSIPLGSWGNQECEKKQGFICQTFKNPNSWISTAPVTTPNTCRSGYTPYWKGCYKLYTDMLTWQAANNKCTNEGADLVSIHSGAENGYIQSLASKDSNLKMPLWIGLRDQDGKGEYKWMDNWAVLYTLWGDDEPSRGDNGGCVRLRPGDGTWEDTVCTAQNGFVCKTTDEPPVTAPPPSQGRCPSQKWVEHGSYCYKFHQVTKDTWSGASLKCKEDSVLANLASIHSVEENHWIYEKLTATGVLSSHVWIGMFRRSDTRGFAWNDLSAVQYEHWAPLEPNGDYLGEDCVGFHKNYHEMWHDQKCDTRQGFVCKAPKVVYPSLPPDGPGICPPKWTNISNHCYLFEPNLHLEWIDARLFCKNQDPSGGADLVSIKNVAEDIFVNTEMVLREDTIGENLQFWIGLTKKKKGAEYKWVDGESTNYTNWDKGEPSGKNDGSTNCGFQYALTARWEDADCNEYKGFACKMEKLPDPSNPPTDGPDEGQPGSGPSGGAVAGIVIGTLIGVALLGALGFFLFKNNINPVTKAKDMVSGFSNPFYTSQEDTKPVKDGAFA